MLTWTNSQRVALKTLLILMPCPSRPTTQAPDPPASVLVSTGPTEPVAAPGKDPHLPETSAPQSAAVRHHHGRRYVVSAHSRS